MTAVGNMSGVGFGVSNWSAKNNYRYGKSQNFGDVEPSFRKNWSWQQNHCRSGSVTLALHHSIGQKKEAKAPEEKTSAILIPFRRLMRCTENKQRSVNEKHRPKCASVLVTGKLGSKEPVHVYYCSLKKGIPSLQSNGYSGIVSASLVHRKKRVCSCAITSLPSW